MGKEVKAQTSTPSLFGYLGLGDKGGIAKRLR